MPPAQDLHGQPATVVQRLQCEAAEVLGLEVRFRHRLRDGGESPEMLVIPPGRFLTGSPVDEAERSENEGPQHQVTFAEYDTFTRCESCCDRFLRGVLASSREPDDVAQFRSNPQSILCLNRDEYIAQSVFLLCRCASQVLREPNEEHGLLHCLEVAPIEARLVWEWQDRSLGDFFPV